MAGGASFYLRERLEDPFVILDFAFSRRDGNGLTMLDGRLTILELVA